MITKKEWCLTVVKQFKQDLMANCRSADEIAKVESMPMEGLIKYCTESTRLGIALEELGILTHEANPDMFNYMKNRGGIMSIAYGDGSKDDPSILSVREFLSLLPDDHEEVVYDFSEEANFPDIKRSVLIITDDNEQRDAIAKKIHNQLKGNEDYIESRLLLNKDNDCLIQYYVFKNSTSDPEITI